MEISQVAVLEQKLNRTFKIAVSLHCVGIAILAYLFGFEPAGYKKTGLILSIAMLITSILLSIPYFNADKKLKHCKIDSPKSGVRKFSEQFLLSFFPYTFWCSCIGIFI